MPKIKRTKEEEILLTFLKRTKSEKYASVEKGSLPYSRIEEKTEYIEADEEEYYYSVR